MNAPEFRVDHWIDGQGRILENPIRLKDYKGKFKIIYCFQNWCPGCHKVGLPSLKKMVDAFHGDDSMVFLAIQTVFEGFRTNTKEYLAVVQKQYNLFIPFGHDDGTQRNESRSTIMTDYRTRGTPYFIIVDENDKVIYSDFHINTSGAIKFLKKRKNETTNTSNK